VGTWIEMRAPWYGPDKRGIAAAVLANTAVVMVRRVVKYIVEESRVLKWLV
jgi:hypothetical protein